MRYRLCCIGYCYRDSINYPDAVGYFVFIIKLMLGLTTEKTFVITDSFGKKITAKGSEMDDILHGDDGYTYISNNDGTVRKE